MNQIPIEKIIEMYGRLSLERDLLAAENAELKQKIATELDAEIKQQLSAELEKSPEKEPEK